MITISSLTIHSTRPLARSIYLAFLFCRRDIHLLIRHVHLPAAIDDHGRGIAPQVPTPPKRAGELLVVGIGEAVRAVYRVAPVNSQRLSSPPVSQPARAELSAAPARAARRFTIRTRSYQRSLRLGLLRAPLVPGVMPPSIRPGERFAGLRKESIGVRAVGDSGAIYETASNPAPLLAGETRRGLWAKKILETFILLAALT